MFKMIFFVLITISSLFAQSKRIPVVALGSGINQADAQNRALFYAVKQLFPQGDSLKIISVLADKDKFLSRITVLDSELKDNKLFTTVRAEIEIDKLNKSFSDMGFSSKEQPRIAVVVQGDLDNEFAQSTLLTINQALSDKGFFLIDLPEQQRFLKEQKSLLYTALNNQIADFGLSLNADFMVRFNLKISNDQGTMYATTEVISPSLAKVVFSVDEIMRDLSKVDEIEKLVKAKELGQLLGEKLSTKLKNHWQEIVKNGDHFVLVLEGYNYQNIIKFQKRMENSTIIKDVFEVESDNNKTTLLIKFTGSRTALKELIFADFSKEKLTTRLLRSENNRAVIKVLN